MQPESHPKYTLDRLIEASGLASLVHSPETNAQLTRMAAALLGVVLTLALGMALDFVWTSSDRGVTADAIQESLFARAQGIPYASRPGEAGVWETFWTHERRAIIGLVVSAVPGTDSVSEGPVGAYLYGCTGGRSVLDHLSRLVGGVWWLARHHTLFFALFATGFVCIWALCGGLICRVSAMQLARGEQVSWEQGLRFCRGHARALIAAPAVPVGICVVCGAALMALGLLMRFPLVGDVLGGALFVFAWPLGALVALAIIGLFAGAPLFLPAVAVGGEDPFSAFSLAMSYAFRKPWKSLWYAWVSLAYAGIAWLVISVTTWAAMLMTRGCLSLFGATPFGLGARGAGEKITSIWTIDGPLALFQRQASDALTWYDSISAFFIGGVALIVTGLTWAYMVSLFFNAGTVGFMLLRRDVDGTDLEEIWLEGPNSAGQPSSTPGAGGAAQ